MKLILHIGMGKTGSSAIQHALGANADRLAGQGAEYLGMWFDMLDPRFRGVQNQGQFFAMAPDDMVKATDALMALLRARSVETGVQTFVLSNEAFSGKARALQPMMVRLRESGVDLGAIGYARHPAAWLPSAYVQWGVRDKVDPGPVPPYAVKARKLVRWYSGLLEWHKLMPEILEVRPYDKAGDVVADFAQAVGLALDVPDRRVLERSEDAEILLRALYNNRFQKHVLPQVFDRSVLPGIAAVPRLEEVVARCFDYSETDAIIADEAPLFERYLEAFGFDPRAVAETPPPMPEIGALRDRLLDALLEITLDQAQRIRKLERRVSQLDTDEARADD